MKKNYFVFIVLCCMLVSFFMGCANHSKSDNRENSLLQEEPAGEENEPSQEESDYKEQEVVGVRWIRNTEYEEETLCFLPNGAFRYSCACGNPVNDSDAVESYRYDETTGMFILNCYEELEGMITEIKFISCDGEKLELDFGGELRTFFKEE